MTRIGTITLASLVSITVAVPTTSFAWEGGLLRLHEPVVAAEDGDPSQGLYKNGYNQILAEQWEKARKTFADLLKRYPQSAYADDARYWSAYALMHVNQEKAITEYREFINRHPRSTYLSDAVADLGNLEQKVEMNRVEKQIQSMAQHRARTDSSMAVRDHTTQEALQRYIESMRTPTPVIEGLPSPDSAPLAPMVWGNGHTPNLGRMDMRGVALSMKRLGWRMRHMFAPEMKRNLDKETQLRLEALTALGQGDEDERSFQMLKDVAIDRSQPVELRLEAMDQLSGFTKHDPAPVLLDIARTDSSQEVQSESLDLLRDCIKDKDKSVQTYGMLYRSLPDSRSDQRSMILFEIADIGNDPAVEFLSNVARHDSSYDLRSEAVYYLGSIGGQKARDVLYDVLLNK